MILQIHKIWFEYKRGNPLISDFSLTVNPGDRVLIEGVSGSGKSTLIHLICGYLKPTAGQIKLFDQDMNRISPYGLARIRRKIGMVTQFGSLLKDINVLENVMMQMLIAGKNRDHAKKKALEMLDKVNMLHKANKSVFELSGGEEQRVCIARALSNDPKIIIADEATSNLDQVNADNVLGLCIEMTIEKNLPLIWTSHNYSQRHLFNKIITLEPAK